MLCFQLNSLHFYWLIFNYFLLVLAAANLYKQFVPRSNVWIETVWHSDGFTEIIFRKKVDFENNQQTSKTCKITQHAMR